MDCSFFQSGLEKDGQRALICDYPEETHRCLWAKLMVEPTETTEMMTPRGDLSIRSLAMPKDTNPAGDIFGGWLLSEMDVAGGVAARVATKGGRIATVAIDSMVFHMPVFVGDVLCCYSDVTRVGRTSITINVQAWALRGGSGERVLVTEGVFTYVHIGADRRPTPIEK